MAEHVLEHPQSVLVRVGLSGAAVAVPLDPGTSLAEFVEALRAAAKIPFEMNAKLSSGGEVVQSMDELLRHQRENEEVYATLVKSVDAMTLPDIVAELVVDTKEFMGHAFTLSKLPAGSSPRMVAEYLWNNNVLLTSDQAQKLFDQLLPRLVARGDRHDLRGQLIIALHSFCLDQHHVWEPDDGNSECLWANMLWQDKHLELQQRHLTRGVLRQWGAVQSSSSHDVGLSRDLSLFREVLRSRQAGMARPLESMTFFVVYGSNWQQL